jgi:hypothetical protein
MSDEQIDEMHLRDSLAERPRSAKLNRDLSKIMSEKGEHGEAVLASLLSLERNPANPAMLISALRVLDRAGLRRLATMLAENVPADSPAGGKLNLTLARLHSKLGAFDRATTYLLQAEALDGASEKTAKIREAIEKRRAARASKPE